MQEPWVWPLDWEDPLEKEMATHSSILAWEIPWTEEPGGLQSLGSHRVGHDYSDLAQHSALIIACYLPSPYQPSSICPGGLLCSAMTGSVYSSNYKPEQVPKYLLSSSTWDKELSVRNRPQKDFPGGPVLKTWLSRATRAGLIPGWGARIPYVSEPKNQNIKQKQYVTNSIKT